MERLSRSTSYLSLHSFLVNKRNDLEGEFNAEFSPWTDKGKVREAVGILRNVSITSNIYNKEDTISVKKFYYPSKVFNKKYDVNQGVHVNLYEDFQSEKSIIIEGTVGQGKSILLRYLHNIELNSSKSFPIFIELKDVGDVSLIEYITKYISTTLGLRCSDALFFQLLSIGAMSLFFDGFDEVEHSKRAKIVDDINNIAHHNSNNKTFCTSRPNNEIQRSNKFDVFCIKPLNNHEQIEFVNKIMESYSERLEYRNQLKKNIDGMNGKLRELLKTPLILTLFIIVYRRKVMVPETTYKFYKMLFSTLVSEHDGMKLGFTRPTISGLSAEQIHTILEYLSFMYVKNLISETDIDFKVMVNGCLSRAQISRGSASEVLEDLSKNTCLIQIDDHEHKFIHESIPFYFAASCIQNNTDDDESKDYYDGRYNTLDDWRHVLDFLQNIDSKNFNRYFLIKQIESLFIKQQLPHKFVFSENTAKRFSKNFKVSFAYINQEIHEFHTDINYLPVTDWVAYSYFTDNKTIKNRVHLKSLMSEIEDKIYNIPPVEFFKKIGKLNRAVKNSNIYIIQDNLDRVLEVFDLEKFFEVELNKVPLDTIKSLYHEVKHSVEKFQENKDKGFFAV
ncbi:NACHT domain-containing protein [Vibrio parahaemolyticus]|uniref:NACHT domain-containing protein n=1 Tax=Vibrio parahaemolyticus TaxID=670 RepID=UPI002491EE32|nr:hypothetical protein [Vibrio parahaemolyticus]